MTEETRQAYKEMAEGLCESKQGAITLRYPPTEAEQRKRDELSEMAGAINRSRCRPIYLDNFKLPGAK